MVINVITGTSNTRLGNHLYFYLQASKNKNMYVEFDENMNYWNKYFKKLESFSLKIFENDKNINKIDMPYSYFQIYGTDYSLNDINMFIKNYLFEDLVNYVNGYSYDLIINIRRGNFYNGRFKYLYGFDQIKYVKQAIKKFEPYDKIAVISDDIKWCEENLYFLNKKYSKVDYLNLEPFESFIELVKAKNLIITNSTFSYWAAYINNFLYSKSRIIAPNYNTILMYNGELITAPENWERIDVDIYTQ